MYNNFQKFKKDFNNKFVSQIRNKYESPEGNFWRERLFGVKKFTWNSFGNLLLRFMVWLIVFTVLLFLFFSIDLPTPWKIKNYQSAQAVQLFDRNGKQIYAMSGTPRRVNLNSSDVPQNIKNATVAAEDHNFYHHIGIDFRGVTRAVYYDIFKRGAGLQGGSTITQQFVKNALLNSQRTIIRKIKELFLSLEVEMMYSKDQIMTMYLNEIPYGSNAYGVEAASETFFNKHASELDLAEAATLAALPQRPTYFSPYGSHPDQRLVRVNYVLDSMVELKYITADQASQAKEEAKTIKFAQPKEYILAPHFALYVKDQLVGKYGEQMVDEGGLKVTTTLNLDKQQMAEDAVSKQAASKFDNINATNAALVAIDPTTGQIISMVGSVDYFNNKIDGQVNVADALRQPGSSFKPVVYATAFKGKYNPGYVLWDVPTDFGNYKPQNYDGANHGPVTMRTALAGSLNVPAVKTLYLAGINNALQTAHDMGITSLNEPDRYGLSLVLGGGEIKLVDLVGAYGTFANNGTHAQTMSILKVEDGHGKVLYEYKEPKTNQALDPQVAYEISSVLSDNGARSYVFGSNSALYLSDRQVAAKTGTTSDYRDAWTIGYTPQLVAGVWVGNNDNSAMKAGSEGAMAAAPIWHNFMTAALANEPKQNFIRPVGITDITVDKLSNKFPTNASPETVTDIFATWQVPTTNDNIHQLYKIDAATGSPATEACPDAFIKKYIVTNLHSEVPTNPNWENPVRAVAGAFGINLTPPQTSGDPTCSSNGNRFGVKISSPDDEETVGASFSVKVTSKSKVSRMDLVVDGQTVGSDSKSPYTFKVNNLSAGRHKITAIGFNSKDSTSSISINVNIDSSLGTIKTDSAPPGNVSGASISSASTVITLSWTNPSDADLKNVNIYQSSSPGDLGSLINTVSVEKSTKTNAQISGLGIGNYWFTLRAVDSSGNENNDSAQYNTSI